MERYITLQSLRKAVWKIPHCSVEAYLVFAGAAAYQKPFRAKHLARKLKLPVHRVERVLRKSPFIKRSGDYFLKRPRIDGIFKDALWEMQGEQLVKSQMTDKCAAPVLVREPLIDYFLAGYRKYGDALSMLDMAVLLAVREGSNTLDLLLSRTHLEEGLLNTTVDNLLNREMLVTREVEGQTLYRFTYKASDIWSLAANGKGVNADGGSGSSGE